MVTIYDNLTGYSPEIEPVLNNYGFKFDIEYNGIRTFKHTVLSEHAYHKIILWPNGMVEFIHYLYGRVFYVQVTDWIILPEYITLCFPDVAKMVEPKQSMIRPTNDDLPW